MVVRREVHREGVPEIVILQLFAFVTILLVRETDKIGGRSRYRHGLGKNHYHQIGFEKRKLF